MTRPDLFEAEHFRNFAPKESGVLERLEQQASEEDIPIIGPALGKILYLLAKAIGARKVLELGTATGYSAIWLAKALGPVGGNLVSIEWNAETARAARANIEEAGYSGVVDVVEGDVREVITSIIEKNREPFDMAFLDVEKEYYCGLIDPVLKVLRRGGLVFFDNTAFKSAGDFLETSYNHPELETAHLYGFFPDHSPDFDAISICLKK